MGQDVSIGRQAGGHDGVREGDGGLQLDQGDVVAAGNKRFRTRSCSRDSGSHTESGSYRIL